MADILKSPFYRVSMKALVLDKKERLLVVQVEDSSWETPGGGWEHGESMQHCLRRELVEELNARVRHIDFSTMYPWSGRRSQGGMSLKLGVYVELEDFDFTVGDNVVAWKFVTAPELAKLEMSDSEGGVKNHIERIWKKRQVES